MKTLKYLSLFLSLLFASYSYSSFDWKGQLSSHGVEVDIIDQEYKGIVLFSLSTVCPCSLSHMPHFESLSKEFSDFLFIGFHADGYATKEEFEQFKTKYQPSFILVNDQNFAFAKSLGAITTPHVFVLSSQGTMLYQGAVSSSHTYSDRNTLHLKNALEKISSDQKIRRAKTKPLGCGLNFK